CWSSWPSRPAWIAGPSPRASTARSCARAPRRTSPGPRTWASPALPPCWPSEMASTPCCPMAISRWTFWRPCSIAGCNGACVADRLTWADIRRLALAHRKSLLLANLFAVVGTLCSVPIPLLLPLLVDEVLLGQAGAALDFMDRLLPAGWRTAAGYIGLMLLFSLTL